MRASQDNYISLKFHRAVRPGQESWRKEKSMEALLKRLVFSFLFLFVHLLRRAAPRLPVTRLRPLRGIKRHGSRFFQLEMKTYSLQCLCNLLDSNRIGSSRVESSRVESSRVEQSRVESNRIESETRKRTRLRSSKVSLLRFARKKKKNRAGRLRAKSSSLTMYVFRIFGKCERKCQGVLGQVPLPVPRLTSRIALPATLECRG